MGLHLTGKGSILDAIGGTLNTAGNTAVAGVKDVGDLGSLGLAKLTGNQEAAQNAFSAMNRNTSNLSGDNFMTNLGGLSQDVGLTQAAKSAIGLGIGAGTGLGNALTGQNLTSQQNTQNTPLSGLEGWASNNNKQNLGAGRTLGSNAVMTGVNLATLGKGKAIEKGIEATGAKLLGKNVVARAATRVAGGSLTAGGYGAGQGASNAVATAKTPKEVVSDIVKPAVQNALIGGGIAGVTTVPSLTRAAKENAAPLTEAGGAKAGDILPDKAFGKDKLPNPITTEEDVAKIQQLGQEPHPALTEPARAEPSPAELHQMTEQFHQDAQNPEIDWTKVQGAGKALNQAVLDKANALQQQEGGLKGGMIQKTTDGGYVRNSEHSPYYRQVFDDTGRKPTKAAWKAEAERQLQTGADAESQNYKNLQRHAQAEQNISDLQKADRASGYDVAKHQLPKGAPARKFVQALWDKTHSPEYRAKSQIGAELGATRNPHPDSIRGQKEQLQLPLKRAKAAYDQAIKHGTLTDETGTRTATDEEKRSISAKYSELRNKQNMLNGLEKNHGLAYRRTSEALDAKYPEINLAAKKGVRVTANQPYETAKPAEIDENGNVVPKTVKVAAAKTETPYKYEPTSQSEPYAGPNQNEGAFSPEDRAQLEVKNQQAAAEHAPSQSIDGDRAILNGIKRGDSVADIVQSYMDVTGATKEAAQRAVGVLKESSHVDDIGAPQNNPLFGTHARYDIGKAPEPRGLNKVLVKAKAGANRLIRNPVINKALLRAVAPSDLLHYKLQDASRLWTKLTPEEQALADRLRGNSGEDLVIEAKGGSQAFLDYAKRVKNIQDSIHDMRYAADPFESTGYRQNYGASFHVADEKGIPTTVNQYLTKEEGWQKGRNFHNYNDIEEASGLKRSTKDFHEDLTKDVATAQRHIKSRSLYNGLAEAFGPDKVFFKAEEGDRPPAGMKELQEFSGVYAAPDIAKRINDRTIYADHRDDALGKVFKGYDALNANMKNVKLSLGGFHNVNIGLSHTVLDPTHVGDAAHAWASDKFFHDKLNEWDADGTLEKALHGGLTMGGGAEFGGKASLLNRGKYNPVRVAHDALFARQIPMSKLSTFQTFTKGLDLNKPKDYQQIRGAARGINNIYGGINRIVDGMSATRLKQVGRVVLAADYNEGQIRIVLSAITKGGVEGSLARQMVGGRMAVLAAPGTIQAIATGQIGNKPQDWAKTVAKQLVDPSVATPWKTSGGTPKRVSLIATAPNKIYRAIAPAFNSNNPDKTSGLKHELAGNEAAGLSFAQQEINNKNYYGAPMHGHGLTALQSFGQAANALAPIPVNPAARAVEGTRFGKNAVVNTLAGGQDAISPVEAATDIVGVGRVAADPNAPVMQIMNNRQMVRESLPTDDQGVLDKIHPSWNQDLTKQQQADIYNNPNYEINKWTSMLADKKVFDAMAKQNAFAKAHGEPGNPLFDLSSKDQQTIMRYQQLKASDPGSDANDTAAVMYARNKDLIDGYEKNAASYGDAMNKLFQQSGGTKGDQGPQITPGGVPFPAVTPEMQALATQYSQLTDPKTKGQFIQDNPQLAQMYTMLANYANDKRNNLNEPLLKDYPQAPAGLQNWITQYTSADKATRSGLRTANPDQYKAMQDYMAQVDEYNLAKTAGQAKFKGQDFSQANLKQIYNLGNYDINPVKNADGTTTYSVNPQAAYAAKSDSYKNSGYAKAYARSKAASQLRTAKAGVKRAGFERKIKISHLRQNRPLRGFGLKGQPHQPKYVTLKAPKTGKLRIKSSTMA